MDLESLATNWILDRFGKTVALTDNLFETGILDSLSFNELLTVLEGSAGKALDFAEIEDWKQLETIAGIVSELGKEP